MPRPRFGPAHEHDLAQVGALPEVRPLAFEFDETYFWLGGTGEAVLGTRKFRNVIAGNHRVALVIDDLVSLSPLIALHPRLRTHR